MPIYRYRFNIEEKYNPNPTGETRKGSLSSTGWYDNDSCSNEYHFPIYAYRPLDPTNEANLECENGNTYIMGEPVVSNDEGLTWTAISGGEKVRITVFDTNSDLCRIMWKYVFSGNTVELSDGFYYQFEIYESNDRGATWTNTGRTETGPFYKEKSCLKGAGITNAGDAYYFYNFSKTNGEFDKVCSGTDKVYVEYGHYSVPACSSTPNVPIDTYKSNIVSGVTDSYNEIGTSGIHYKRTEIPYEINSTDCGWTNPYTAVVFDLDYQSVNGRIVLLETYYPKIATTPDTMFYHDYHLFHPMYAWNDETGECHNFLDGSINMNINGFYDIGFNVTNDGIYHVRFLYYGDVSTVTQIDSPFENTHIYDLKYPISSIFPNFTKWSRFIIGSDGNMSRLGPEPDEYPDYTNWGSFNQLTHICDDFFDNATEQENLDGAFAYTRMENIPQGLFDNMTELKNIDGIFRYSNLRTLPSGLFKYNKKITSAKYSFGNCWLMDEEGFENLTDDNNVHFTQRSVSSHDGYSYINPTNAEGMFMQWMKTGITCSGNIRTDYAFSPLNWKYCPRLYNRTCSAVTSNQATSEQLYISGITESYFSSYIID